MHPFTESFCLSVIAVAIIFLFIYLMLLDRKTQRLQNPAKIAVASITAAIDEVKSSRAATYMPYALHKLLFEADCQSLDLSARVPTIKSSEERTEFILKCDRIVDGIKAAAAKAMTAEEREAENKYLTDRLAKIEVRASHMRQLIQNDHRAELERHARKVQEQRDQIAEEQARLARF